MMMPSIPSNSSHSGGASASSAVVRVEKATSEFLIGPDWTMNIDICDTVNSNQWLAKDVVKAVKKRVQHRNPKVQLLALTLLETMVKNCGDYVHFQVADRNILQEMVKIVKKKTDMHVRDKILVLLDSWQEAFGGPGGKYPQYYWAYEELRRSGVEFPQRSFDSAPIFTPPMTHPTPRAPQPGYGMPSNSSTRLDEVMAAEIESLSLSSISGMRDVLDLLADMLQAVDPGDRSAVKDEIIVDLVDRCRSNQKKLMQMLTTTVDEELLGQGLELNDGMQSVLAKHDAIASGSPLPTPITSISIQSSETHHSSRKPAETPSPTTIANGSPSAPALPVIGNQIDEEEEEEDDFALLARRHSKAHPSASQASSQSGDGGSTPKNPSSNIKPEDASSSPANALVPVDPPAPIRTTKEQDIIDLLSITLSTSMSSTETPEAPTATEQPQQVPSPTTQGNNPYASQAYLGSQGQTFNSYVAPWAQAHPQPQVQPQVQPQYHSHYYSQPQPQVQPQPQLSQYSNAYPPPPWAATPGYFSNPNPSSRPAYAYGTPPATSTVSASSQGIGTLQQVNSVPAGRGNNISALNGGDASVGSANRNNIATPPPGQKPFVPSYRLFEDLNVLPNSSPSLNGSMVRGK
ncbi:hypothetical protein M9H77_22361 [Catharanthus roseus]|uniref:Uncharacterized protein n=1 Tax=Catharanthus roseus TaxID=4058 RepID=A0ACC0AUB4_CATRO|nr:hypothetical protein M9H77_22361 [Catharanthus roseus]